MYSINCIVMFIFDLENVSFVFSLLTNCTTEKCLNGRWHHFKHIHDPRSIRPYRIMSFRVHIIWFETNDMFDEELKHISMLKRSKRQNHQFTDSLFITIVCVLLCRHHLRNNPWWLPTVILPDINLDISMDRQNSTYIVYCNLWVRKICKL